MSSNFLLIHFQFPLDDQLIILIIFLINRILYEQTKAERDQLRVNLSEANARADLLAQEVDDHHAKLEKTSKEKLM